MSQSDADRYAAKQKANREFKAYLKTLSEKLPDLTVRTFALRGKMYSGCGFHWSLERSLGKLIVAANDFENAEYWKDGREGMAARIMVEVGFESFMESLEEAERSAAMTPEEAEVEADKLAAEFQAKYGAGSKGEVAP